MKREFERVKEEIPGLTKGEVDLVVGMFGADRVIQMANEADREQQKLDDLDIATSDKLLGC